jgi:hypothetical protein
VHELLGNALMLTGEKQRVADLRGEPFIQATLKTGCASEVTHA